MSKRYQGGILGVGFNPLQAPNAPTNVTATGGDASASVAFTAPTNVGGSAITGYTVRSNPGGVAATGSASPITVSGLSNGTAYTFNVWALNSYGPSPAGGPSGSVTPSLPVWMGVLTGSPAKSGYATTIDTAGNYIYAGYAQAGYVAKLTTTGSITWQKNYTVSNFEAEAVRSDSSNNVYFSGTQGTQMFLVKLDSAGSTVYRSYWDYSAYTMYEGALDVDSSQNVYVGYNANINPCTGQVAGRVIKIGSTGTTGTRFLLPTDWRVFGVSVDASQNFYVAGTKNAPGFLLRFNSSNTLNLQKTITPTSGNAYIYSVLNTSSGDIYVSGSDTSSGSSAGAICKLDSTGAILWQRTLSGCYFERRNSIALDASGNVYVVGNNNSSPPIGIIAKYNSSGTLQWQRRISVTNGIFLSGISVSGDFMSICGTSQNGAGNSIFVVKLPTDGSKTGSYNVNGVSYTYSANTGTDSAGTFSVSNSSETISPQTGYNPNADTSTISNAALTASVTAL